MTKRVGIFIGLLVLAVAALFLWSRVRGFLEGEEFAGEAVRDQIEDYARRKGMSVAEAEKWLMPYLNYDPDSALVRPCQPGATVAA